MPTPTSPMRVRRRDLEAKVWALRCQGQRQTTIAEALGVNQGTVSRVLRRVEQRTLAEVHARAHTMRAVQTEQLETLIEQLWRAWRGDQNPKHAEQLRMCLADLRKLWGLDTPMSLALSVSPGPDLSGLTDEEVEIAARVFRKLRGLPDDGVPEAVADEPEGDEIPPLPGVETREIADPDGGPPMVVVFPGRLPN
jgi:DNA-binding MarR family transcriptional regulator